MPSRIRRKESGFIRRKNNYSIVGTEKRRMVKQKLRYFWQKPKRAYPLDEGLLSVQE